MTQAGQFEIAWAPREFPLTPAAMAARGEASVRLARRLRRLDDETLLQLHGVAGKQLIVLQGEPSLLPWVDGVQYLGIDARAPGVLFPTQYRPNLPPELLAGAIIAKTKATAGLIALLPNPLLVIPMERARPVSRSALLRWLETA